MSSENISQEPLSQVDQPDEVPQLTAPQPIEEPSSPVEVREETRSSGANTTRRILGCLFQTVLFLAVIAAVVAGVYFGWPIVYRNYILPVQNNTARVAAVEADQQSSQELLSGLQTQLPALTAAQADQSAALEEQASRVEALESTIQAQALALATAQAEQAAAVSALSPQLAALESAIETQTQALAELESTQASLQAVNARARADLERQITLIKSMELLSKARLFLYQSNFGMARQDVQAARNLLADMPAPEEPTGDVDLNEVVQRLDLALSRLPDYPVAASDDLDIAWQILLGGEPQQLATPIPTAVIENTPTPQATPLAETPEATPTATLKP